MKKVYTKGNEGATTSEATSNAVVVGGISERYTTARRTDQVDGFVKTTKAIAEYVGKQFGRNMMWLVQRMEETTFQIPTLSTNATRVEELQWTRDYDLYIKNKQKYEDEKARVFAIILGQCDETMKNKVESKGSVYEKMQRDSDVIALLNMIKESAFDAHEKQYAPRQAAVAWKQLAHLHQQNEESLVQYHSRFVEMVQRMEGLFGGVAPTAVAKKEKGRKMTDAEKVSKAREQVLAVLFMEGGVKGFRPLLRDLENDQALGASLYPETIADALQVMMRYQEQPIYKSIMKNVNKKFTITDEENPDFSFMMSKVEMMKKRLCFKCGKPGHKTADCTKKKSDEGEAMEQQHAQVEDGPGASWMR